MSGTTDAIFERQVVSTCISNWLSVCNETVSKTGPIWWNLGTKYPSPSYIDNYFSISLFPTYSWKILITTFSIVNYIEGILSNLYQIISVMGEPPQFTYPLYGLQFAELFRTRTAHLRDQTCAFSVYESRYILCISGFWNHPRNQRCRFEIECIVILKTCVIAPMLFYFFDEHVQITFISLVILYHTFFVVKKYLLV